MSCSIDDLKAYVVDELAKRRAGRRGGSRARLPELP